MANPNAPFGFRPVKSLSGEQVTVNFYPVSSSASRIGKGDLVKVTSGYLVRETSSTAVGPWAGISMADTGTLTTGGIAAHPVCDDPNAIFICQSSTAANTVTLLNTIKKVDCSAGIDSNYGTSKAVLTNTAATATNGVRVIRFHNRPDQVVGASSIVEVRLNADYYNGNLS